MTQEHETEVPALPVVSRIEDPSQQNEVAAVLAIVARAAADPTVDIDKLERLMQMQERALARQAEQEFNAALNRAQSRLGRVSADAVNPQTRSAYASYAALDKAVRPVYTSEGFSLSFDTGDPQAEGYVRVICHVSHARGHTRIYHVDIPADGKGAKGNDVMTKTHAVGSGMSYGKRYLVGFIFNIAIGDNDDDGNAAGSPTITEAQEIALRDLVEEVDADLPKFLAYMKVGALSGIPAKHYQKAESALKAKAKTQGKANG